MSAAKDPRADASVVFFDDGVFIVRISPDRARGRWYVDAFFKGRREESRSVTAHSDPHKRRGRPGDPAVARALAEAHARILRDEYLAGRIVQPEAPPYTLGSLIDRFLSRATSKRGVPLSPGTIRAYNSQLQALVAVSSPDLPVIHLSARHVQAAVARPPSDRSKAQYLRAIRALVRWGMAKGWLPVDVTQDIVVDPGPNHRRPMLQPEEIPAFLAALPPSMRIRAGLVLETGLRAGEAVAARWSWVERSMLSNGLAILRIPDRDPVTGFVPKGRKGRIIPLSDAAERCLVEAAEMWGESGFLLHDQGRGRGTNRRRPTAPKPDKTIRTDNWWRDVQIACDRATLKKRGPGGAEIEVPITRVDVHGLRRTAGMLWLQAGATIYEVSQLLGHTSVTTTERWYAGLADSQLVDVIRRVNQRASLPRIGIGAATTERGNQTGTRNGTRGRPNRNPS